MPYRQNAGFFLQLIEDVLKPFSQSFQSLKLLNNNNNNKNINFWKKIQWFFEKIWKNSHIWRILRYILGNFFVFLFMWTAFKKIKYSFIFYFYIWRHNGVIQVLRKHSRGGGGLRNLTNSYAPEGGGVEFKSYVRFSTLQKKLIKKLTIYLDFFTNFVKKKI